MAKKYRVTLTEKQFSVIQDACEEYLRVRLGQGWYLADELSGRTFNLSRDDNPNFDRDFHVFLEKRDMARIALDAALRITLQGSNGVIQTRKEPEDLVAEDIFEAFRHQRWLEKPEDERSFWTVDAGRPLNWSEEPLPEIEMVE